MTDICRQKQPNWSLCLQPGVMCKQSVNLSYSKTKAFWNNWFLAAALPQQVDRGMWELVSLGTQTLLLSVALFMSLNLPFWMLGDSSEDNDLCPGSEFIEDTKKHWDFIISWSSCKLLQHGNGKTFYKIDINFLHSMLSDWKHTPAWLVHIAGLSVTEHKVKDIYILSYLNVNVISY